MWFSYPAILHFFNLNLRYLTSPVTNDDVIRIFLSDLVLNLLPFKFHRCTIYYVKESCTLELQFWRFIYLAYRYKLYCVTSN